MPRWLHGTERRTTGRARQAPRRAAATHPRKRGRAAGVSSSVGAERPDPAAGASCRRPVGTKCRLGGGLCNGTLPARLPRCWAGRTRAPGSQSSRSMDGTPLGGERLTAAFALSYDALSAASAAMGAMHPRWVIAQSANIRISSFSYKSMHRTCPAGSVALLPAHARPCAHIGLETQAASSARQSRATQAMVSAGEVAKARVCSAGGEAMRHPASSQCAATRPS
eukprot:scaffold1790_cov130-Isochrysis_galbana.AAC.5